MLSFFTLDVLDEIWDLIESVSEGFLTYFLTSDLVLSYTDKMLVFRRVIIVLIFIDDLFLILL